MRIKAQSLADALSSNIIVFEKTGAMLDGLCKLICFRSLKFANHNPDIAEELVQEAVITIIKTCNTAGAVNRTYLLQQIMRDWHRYLGRDVDRQGLDLRDTDFTRLGGLIPGPSSPDVQDKDFFKLGLAISDAEPPRTQSYRSIPHKHKKIIKRNRAECSVELVCDSTAI